MHDSRAKLRRRLGKLQPSTQPGHWEGMAFGRCRQDCFVTLRDCRPWSWPTTSCHLSRLAFLLQSSPRWNKCMLAPPRPAMGSSFLAFTHLFLISYYFFTSSASAVCACISYSSWCADIQVRKQAERKEIRKTTTSAENLAHMLRENKPQKEKVTWKI